MAGENLTDQQYYENPDLWGEAQFITLQNVIDNILITADDDSYFKHAKYFRASIFGKMGIKKLNVDLKAENKAISIQLAPSKIFPYPKYMTNWSRISVLNKCGKLVPLNTNSDPLIQDYLQDHEYNLLYDCNGSVLEGASFNAEQGDCCLEFECADLPECGCEEENFDDSWVKDDKSGSYFVFSDDLVDRLIVIEFQSAGLDCLDDCDIKVHHNLEDTLTAFIKWKLLEGKRNVPMNEVLYWKNEYKIQKRRSKNLLSDKITLHQLMKSVSLRYNG